MKPTLKVLTEAVVAGKWLEEEIETLKTLLGAKEFTIRAIPDSNIRNLCLKSTPALVSLIRTGAAGGIMAKLAQCEAVGADVTDLRTKAEHLLSNSPV